ncbi:sigma factor regulator N-terminal domain-containing protein [Levilactobacillus sp. N40-8-2]|uniref:sigma factor regulator N-terminal domain-containing protein n=1 Tax=Levilactobacillus muriae TaxID=3238987 RepID=UPI0038B3B4DB
MNESNKFRRLAWWVRIRRWGITVAIVVLVILVALPVAYKLTQIRAAKESNEIMQQMTLDDEIRSPNIEISDRYLGNTSPMGGQVISHRYKEIEGYRIPWSPRINNYSWLIGRGDDLTGSTDWGDATGAGLYDRVTQQKMPVLFNAKVKKSEVTPTNDIAKVAQTKNAVAEVAVTFKQPMTYHQVRATMPARVHVQWYWIGVTGKADSTMIDNDLLGVQAPSPISHPGKLTPADYAKFAKGLRQAGKEAGQGSYDGFNSNRFAGEYGGKYRTLNQAKFAGVIVTGNSEAFHALTKANWIYASSAGFFKQRSVIK